MSPRAAARLETLGFEDVYDYVAGKTDWTACGLPLEGRPKDLKLVSDLLNTEVATSRPTEKTGEVAKRIRSQGYNYCPVVNESDIVLGLFRIPSAPTHSEDAVEDQMQLGPTTFRANTSVDQAAAFMAKNNRSEVLITSSDGKFLGVLTREVADHAVHELGPQK